MMSKIARVLRLRESIKIMQLNAVAGLIYIFFLMPIQDYFFSYVIFLAYQFFLISYGFIVNSYSDMDVDLLVGKDFSANKFTKKSLQVIILALAIPAVIIPLLMNMHAALIGLAAFFLASAYSLKPLRLKERGLIGAVCSSLPQSMLPFMFFVGITDYNIFAIIIGVWLFLKHTRNEMAHQMLDHDSDIKSGTKSLVVRWGRKKTAKFVFFVGILFTLWNLVPFLLSTSEGFFLGIVLIYFSLPDIGHTFRI